MGATNSKSEKTEALKMCKLRKKLIKQGIDSRYSIAAAHISYIQSLKNIGIALRRFAEAEVLLESSLSPSGNTNTTYPSPSPSHIVDYYDDAETTVSENHRLSYMKSGGNVGISSGNSNNVALTFRYNPSTNMHTFVDNGSHVNDDEPLVLPPPPPPPPDCGSWDFFDPGGDDSGESFRFVGLSSVNVGAESVKLKCLEKDDVVEVGKNENGVNLGRKDEEVLMLEKSGSKMNTSKDGMDKELNEEREDPSEFITHRAKDFLSSIKDIEHKFFRASESGKEVSRMLEANKIRVGYAEAKGSSSTLSSLAVCHLVCCRSKSVHASNDLQSAPKVIVWNRSMSSQSSSSRNPLATSSKDDADDSGSDCVDDFFMISGSHSSTLDRLYAWERKLYDEVKASEVIRKVYDKKCDQLRHQFAKDISTHVVDKTRTAVKDLHSRIRVALHAVDSIAKRIEKMRDEELLPQLTELITGYEFFIMALCLVPIVERPLRKLNRSEKAYKHGRVSYPWQMSEAARPSSGRQLFRDKVSCLNQKKCLMPCRIARFIRMWKAMLECHHAQYITISLAYHAKTSLGTPLGDTRKEIMSQLQYEFECFGVSFADWMNSHTSYVEAINGWLQNCVMLPQERTRGSRRPFSPRRVLAPPIFVLCRDWSAGIRALPSEDVSDAIRNFLTDLHFLVKQQHANENKEAVSQESKDNVQGKDEKEEGGGGGEERSEDNSGNLGSIHTSLTKVLDKLTKFSEASLKLYEDIRQKSEAARVAYSNPRPTFRY
ncbi:hypothetical protein KSS87_008214 [Heliosperma pusillum]|nr:hypothetical protein KSS87_008214 [Heliosperma pusillum]